MALKKRTTPATLSSDFLPGQPEQDIIEDTQEDTLDSEDVDESELENYIAEEQKKKPIKTIKCTPNQKASFKFSTEDYYLEKGKSIVLPKEAYDAAKRAGLV